MSDHSEARRTRRAARLSVASLATVVALTTGGLAALGVATAPRVDMGDDPADPTSGATFNLAHSPAQEFIDTLAREVDDQWETTGWVHGAKAPHPLGCGSLIAPVRSFSVTVTEPHQAQVYAAVYPAGMGAAELEAQMDGAGECASSVSRSEIDLGAGGSEVSSWWNGTRTTTQAWRHGDVILHVSSDQSTALAEVPGELDGIAAGLLDRCVEPASTVDDALRSPLHADFQGWLQEHEVTIEEPELTDATRLPEPLEIEEVTLPASRPYPVWPLLPDPVEMPTDPERPEWPTTSTTVLIEHEDPTGPGCGWAFTGQVPPAFDEDEVRSANEKTISDATAKLDQGVESWRQAVKDFWAGWPQHVRAVEAYQNYAERVAEVEEAWAPIDDAWDEYYLLYREYEREVERYTRATERRQAASEWYEEQIAKCELASSIVDDYDQSIPETPDSDPNPEGAEEEVEEDAAVDPSPASAAEPDRVREARAQLAYCPPERPELLDLAEPAEPVAPVPPPDPTPRRGETT